MTGCIISLYIVGSIFRMFTRPVFVPPPDPYTDHRYGHRSVYDPRYNANVNYPPERSRNDIGDAISRTRFN